MKTVPNFVLSMLLSLKIRQHDCGPYRKFGVAISVAVTLRGRVVETADFA
jgi:hypothetical protein